MRSPAEKQHMKFVYPEGKRKALTFSYDDGLCADRQLVSIFNQYGLKGTFHLVSGFFDTPGAVGSEEVKTLYAGHEVACHGVNHIDPLANTLPQMVVELQDNKRELETVTGKRVSGLSYAYGRYSEEVKQLARALGIQYSRTVLETNEFNLPEDFLEWHPTCHHNSPRLKELGERFLTLQDFFELPLMYVWGHSFEFDEAKNWNTIEEFAELMSGKDDVWYATNGEIADYITAVRNLQFSADCTHVFNPSALSVWCLTESGLLELKPGAYQQVK